MATMPPMSRIISVSDLPWEERQSGVKRKLLWEKPATQRRALMHRIEPRAQLPRHRHVGDALVFVIEGALSDECGTITAGNMGYRPQGCIHTLATTHGATALCIITGGTAPPSEILALHERYRGRQFEICSEDTHGPEVGTREEGGLHA